MAKKKTTKRNENRRLQTAAHQTAMFLAGLELGSKKERLKLAERLANNFPMRGGRDQFFWISLYTELIVLVRRDGVDRWHWIIAEPNVFENVIQLMMRCLPSIMPAQVYQAANVCGQKNINLRNATLLAERCGANFIPLLTELIEQGLVDNHVANTLRRRPQLVIERSEIGLRCLLADYRRDHERLALSLELYAEHHRPNLGYCPPESGSPTKPTIQRGTLKVGSPPQTPTGRKRRHQPRAKAAKPELRPSGDAPPPPDASRLHLELELSDILPEGLNLELIQILLVHVFFRPSQSRSYVGSRKISEQVLKRRLAPRLEGRQLILPELDAALTWLKQIGLVQDQLGYSLLPSVASQKGKLILERLYALQTRYQG